MLKPGDANEVRIAVLVACAGALQVAESLLPHPLPGVRLGLANLVTLIALVELGPAAALRIAALRTVAGSMVLGTFLSPAFVLSFAGALAGAGVMALCRLPTRDGRAGFGIIGTSVAGAFAHTLAQVLIVWLLFVRSAGVLWLWPWLALASVATGIITGLIAIQALDRLAEAPAPGLLSGEPASTPVPPGSASASPASSPLRRLAPQWKLLLVAGLALAVVLFARWWLYAATLGLLAVLTVAGRVPVVSLFRALLRLLPLASAALILPVLFTPWGRILVALGPVSVTDQGLASGLIFAARLALLVLAVTLLAATTSPGEIAAGLAWLAGPLRLLGIDPERASRPLALSWQYLPRLVVRARQLVGRGAGRTGALDRLVHLPGDLVADLYLLADAEAGLRQ